MISQAKMNASGARTVAPGIRYGRGASGTCLRKALRASGAPAYISTDAEVTRPTSDFQLGNGSRNSRPSKNARIRLNHGTPFLSVQRNGVGKNGVPWFSLILAFLLGLLF